MPEQIPLEVDFAPTFGEIGLSMWRLAMAGETEMLTMMRPYFMRAMANSEALHRLNQAGMLTDAQLNYIRPILARESEKANTSTYGLCAATCTGQVPKGSA